jgi:hypothetical protein
VLAAPGEQELDDWFERADETTWSEWKQAAAVAPLFASVASPRSRIKRGILKPR